MPRHHGRWLEQKQHLTSSGACTSRQAPARGYEDGHAQLFPARNAGPMGYRPLEDTALLAAHAQDLELRMRRQQRRGDEIKQA